MQVVLQLSILYQVCSGFCRSHDVALISTDVANAVKCSTITLYGFTVPPGKSLNLKLVAGATVTMCKCPNLPQPEGSH